MASKSAKRSGLGRDHRAEDPKWGQDRTWCPPDRGSEAGEDGMTLGFLVGSGRGRAISVRDAQKEEQGGGAIRVQVGALE